MFLRFLAGAWKVSTIQSWPHSRWRTSPNQDERICPLTLSSEPRAISAPNETVSVVQKLYLIRSLSAFALSSEQMARIYEKSWPRRQGTAMAL
jgi:hypothetical protein